MAKRIHLNAFSHHAASSQSFGQWKDPANTMTRGYLDPEYWVRLAQTCERGIFDSMFFADAPGVKDVYGGDHRMTAKSGMQFPGNDPTFLPPVMARETEHLGFIITFATNYFQPFHTARVFTTLDHMTGGRIGWNIVTGYMAAALKNGMGEEMPHDERYDRADEYMEVVYKLWEQSWADDAVVLDAASSTYADPDKVRRIDHQGPYFSVAGPHHSEPSPQRTPLLAQAGGSARGSVFAATHAELVFMIATSIADARAATSHLREAAARAGRHPQAIKVMPEISWVVAETEQKAKAKFEHYLETADVDGALALLGGHTDTDFTGFDPAAPLKGQTSTGITTVTKIFDGIEGSEGWTFADLTDYLKLGYTSPTFVGTPAQIADTLEEWVDGSDIDGFVLTPIQAPGDIEDFVDMVVPELQRRGRVPTEYEGRTLRETVMGHPGLAPDHPGYCDRATPGAGAAAG
jgi:FMN-dependent oxidoreductase (nitrilotriacetate monooxygenase family)